MSAHRSSRSGKRPLCWKFPASNRAAKIAASAIIVSSAARPLGLVTCIGLTSSKPINIADRIPVATAKRMNQSGLRPALDSPKGEAVTPILIFLPPAL